jgi:hypothetical protein
MNNNPFLSLYYNNRQIETRIPEQSFNYQFLQKIFSPEILSKVISNDNIDYLKQFLPENMSNILNNPTELSNFLLNSKTKFDTPINDFYQKFLHHFFSYNYQSNREIFKMENILDYMEKKRLIYIQLENMLNNVQKNANIININNSNNNASNFNNLSVINPNVIRNTHSNNGDNRVTFDMNSELASSGYTSLDADKDSKNSNSRKNSANLGGNTGERNNINNSNYKDQQNQKFGMNINNSNKNNQINKIITSTNNSFLEPSDENDSFIDRNILKSDRFKNIKKNKIQITIKPRTKEEIQNFRRQEKLRYQKPLQPWEYTLSKGNIAIVAPLFNSSKAITSKARDHELLKAERPPYITLLALVRDAAARLEDGVGTRLDICDLLKDSQYINENIADSKINSIVSGALDRLHYQKDPCVKYDSHHKLWIYLHRNRSLNYPGWKKIDNNEDNNNDNTNANNNNNIIIEDNDDNEEMNDKNNAKKKKVNEIIEVDDDEEDLKVKDDDNEKNICKIKIDSSDTQPNLIELNEKIYNNQSGKKIKSSILGKKRSKK